MIFLLLVALNRIHGWYFCDVCTGPAHPIFCLSTTTLQHNLNFPQPFVIFIIFYIFTSLSQSYPCYCSETCTDKTNSIFFVFHVVPGLCHLDYSFSVCKISQKLNFSFIYLFFYYCVMHCNPYCEKYVQFIFNYSLVFSEMKVIKILCMKGKVTNTTTCYRLMLQLYMFKNNMPKNVER